MSEYKQFDEDFAYDNFSGGYAKHVSAMTGEKLHSKADIAWELAYRDYRIEQLERDLAELKAQPSTREVIEDVIVGARNYIKGVGSPEHLNYLQEHEYALRKYAQSLGGRG